MAPTEVMSTVRIHRQWTRTLASNRLQSPVAGYSYQDFPWPETPDAFPRHEQVLGYLAARFDVDDRVRFRSTVVAAKYVGAGPEDALGWHWSSAPVRLTVRQHNVGGETETMQVHEFDFVVLGIGRFNGMPNIPAASPDPDAFRGWVLQLQLHSMELAAMADASVVVGGAPVPCTLFLFRWTKGNENESNQSTSPTVFVPYYNIFPSYNNLKICKKINMANSAQIHKHRPMLMDALA